MAHSLNAGVYFITKPEGQAFDKSNKPCVLQGYKIKPSECLDGRSLFDKCPTGEFYRSCRCDTSQYPYSILNCQIDKLAGENCASTYYEKCECDLEKYKYNEENCKNGRVLGGESCDDVNFTQCNCGNEYIYDSSNCQAPKALSGDSCGGKYKVCQCNNTLFPYSKCDFGHNGDTCTDSRGTFYQECKAATCPAGTVDPTTYFDGKLSSIINVAAYSTVINGKTCVTLPTCESFNFNNTRTCVGQDILRCPFDLSKIYCHYN
ncbi:MAG: hypothetical protein PHE89_01435 [Alphaproteobacteria bacterium]|nr:hypothetical protein [Alphaproteobacteria bacterium]